MILIYPAQSAALSGQAIINDRLTADFSLEAGYAPGEAACLAFEAMDVSIPKLVFGENAQAGEVMLLGADSR